jgi:hypothetical protein
MRGIGRSTLAIPLVALGVLAVAGSAVAVTSAGDTLRAGATKKTTVTRVEDAFSTSSDTFTDITGSQATIRFSRASILLVTLTAESPCFGGAGHASWCSVRILVDGVGQLGPGLGNDFAFDSTNFGNDSQFSWEGHAMQRSSNVLPPGTYTVRPQFAVFGPATFQIDDIHVTVEAVQA